ncbi:TolC family protein [Williamwhitmania taraxaci]|uniref:Outer membrane protein TolC n=1 Tax=Williamwhitmania taraxaci TaxID=1640674 RepID=A0A1G6S5J6_9BACT|nr:TolC family protein [Williamwhitmania taraxaci]SDD11934.1 Outer membrane protein TolC [Williamwhitmania taraxaci]
MITNRKNNRHKYTVALIATYLCLFLPAYSQSDSLAVYLDLAARNNPGIVQKYNEYQAALQKVPQVGSLPDPDLSIGIFLSPMEVLSGNQVADIRLMQMFPWFGVLKSAKDEMSLMAKAKFESLREAKLQLFFDVQRTAYEYQRIRQNISISQRNVELMRAIERLTLVKFKSSSGSAASTQSNSLKANSSSASASGGMSSSMGGNSANSASPSTSSGMASSSMGASSGGSDLADVYRIQIEIGDLENSISLLQNQSRTVTAKFNSYLNRSMESAIFLSDTLVPDTLGISLIAASDSMLANNPMLGMLSYEKQSLEARKRMVSRMGYPMVGLGVNYTVISKNPMSNSSMNGKDMLMPMVTVTLPIYRKKYRAMQAEAVFQQTATEQSYSTAANALQTEYYEAMQLYQDAERRITLYKAQSALAQRTLEIMVTRFSASESLLTDILRVRLQTLDYELKQVEAVADYNTATAWIKRLMAFSPIQ